MTKLRFSGHESFPLRVFWPLKGYEFLANENDFNKPEAIVDLGIGKNMVASIRFWLKSLGLSDENDRASGIASFLFSETGKDPYLEDIGTIWLLHYFLVKTNHASLYHLFFNEFSKDRVLFTKENLEQYIKFAYRKNDDNGYNPKTISNDISVLLRNYLRPSLRDRKVDIENEFISIFIDLDLIKDKKNRQAEGSSKEQYLIEREHRDNLPLEIFLFTILDNPDFNQTISFGQLIAGQNFPGNVFLMNRDAIYKKVKEAERKYDFIRFSQTAGNQIVQFSGKPDKFELLSRYYAD